MCCAYFGIIDKFSCNISDFLLALKNFEKLQILRSSVQLRWFHWIFNFIFIKVKTKLIHHHLWSSFDRIYHLPGSFLILKFCFDIFHFHLHAYFNIKMGKTNSEYKMVSWIMNFKLKCNLKTYKIKTTTMEL